MIKGLTGGSNIIVNGGNTSVPYVNQNTNNPMTGMMRVWGNDMQVFDGTAWVTMATSYATVDLSHDSQSLLQWARDQRNKQHAREAKMKSNPALAKAYEAIQRAEANFDILYKFVENDDNPESEAGSVQAGP